MSFANYRNVFCLQCTEKFYENPDITHCTHTLISTHIQIQFHSLCHTHWNTIDRSTRETPNPCTPPPLAESARAKVGH